MVSMDIVDAVQRARRGDPAAFGQLYGQVRDRLLPVLRRSLPSQADAEDLLSEVMVKLMRSMVKLRNPRQFFTYAHQVARHCRLDWQRRQLRWRRVVAARHWRSTVADVGLRNLVGEEFLAALVGSLTPQEAGLFRLLYVVGTADAEVQAQLGISATALRLRRLRLRRKLQPVALAWQ